MDYMENNIEENVYKKDPSFLLSKKNSGKYSACIIFLFLKNYTTGGINLNSLKDIMIENGKGNRHRLFNWFLNNDKSICSVFGYDNDTWSPHTNDVLLYLWEHFKSIYIEHGYNELKYPEKPVIDAENYSNKEFCSLLMYYSDLGFFNQELKNHIIDIISKSEKTKSINVNIEDEVIKLLPQYKKVKINLLKQIGIDFIDNDQNTLVVKPINFIDFVYNENSQIYVDITIDFENNINDINYLLLVKQDLSEAFLLKCKDNIEYIDKYELKYEDKYLSKIIVSSEKVVSYHKPNNSSAWKIKKENVTFKEDNFFDT